MIKRETKGVKKKLKIVAGVGALMGIFSIFGSKVKKGKPKELINMYQELERYQLLYVNNEPTLRVKKKKVKKEMDISLGKVKVVKGKVLKNATVYYKYDKNNKEIVGDLVLIVPEEELEGLASGYELAYGKEMEYKEDEPLEESVKALIKGVKTIINK